MKAYFKIDVRLSTTLKKKSLCNVLRLIQLCTEPLSASTVDEFDETDRCSKSADIADRRAFQNKGRWGRTKAALVLGK